MLISGLIFQANTIQMKNNLDKIARSIREQEMNERLAGKNKNLWAFVVEVCGRHKSDYDSEKPFNSKDHDRTKKSKDYPKY